MPRGCRGFTVVLTSKIGTGITVQKSPVLEALTFWTLLAPCGRGVAMYVFNRTHLRAHSCSYQSGELSPSPLATHLSAEEQTILDDFDLEVNALTQLEEDILDMAEKLTPPKMTHDRNKTSVRTASSDVRTERPVAALPNGGQPHGEEWCPVPVPHKPIGVRWHQSA